MTNTHPLAPTDAELDELRQANSGRLNFVTLSEFRTIARAVLAKWGSQPVACEPLTPREMELIDGMIAVQLDHATRCDAIANRAMADKQKGWDMERVALLRKLKAAHGIKAGRARLGNAGDKPPQVGLD